MNDSGDFRTAPRKETSREDGGEGKSPSLLLVDDDDDLRDTLRECLKKNGYTVFVGSNGNEGLERFFQCRPALVLSDYKMPGMNGVEFLSRVREESPETGRILCSAYADLQLAVTAINQNAVDRILLKPFSFEELNEMISACLEEVSSRRSRTERLAVFEIENHQIVGWNRTLQKELQMRAAILERLTEVSIFALAKLAEVRAGDIERHLRRMQGYVHLLANGMLGKAGCPMHLNNGYVNDIVVSAVLHDVGKVGIPDGILFKPGKLLPSEFEVMKMHAVIGRNVIREAQEMIRDQSYLSLGETIAGCHHEKWDGKGYPDGLSGDDIPFSARIVSVADVYDALTSSRVYKPAWSHEKAVHYIRDGAGTQFDPFVVATFMEMERSFRSIREEGGERAP